MISIYAVLCWTCLLQELHTYIIMDADPYTAVKLCRYPGSEYTTKPMVGTRSGSIKIHIKANPNEVVSWYAKLLLQREFSEDLLADYPTYQIIALKRDRQMGQRLQLDRLLIRSVPGKATVSVHIVTDEKEVVHVAVTIVSHRP